MSSIIENLLYQGRGLRYRSLYSVLRKYCYGNVLDIGGRNFFLSAKKAKISFSHWTTLDLDEPTISNNTDDHFQYIQGDGCKTSFEDQNFDVVLNLHVLEHVMDPLQMVQEVKRVLKKDGTAIFLIPQTATMHSAPNHFCNFTRFWIKEAMNRNGLTILEFKPLGGIWNTLASRLLFFYLQSFRFKGMSTKECKRNLFFYLLFPIMICFAAFAFPIALLLSLGDLTEEANNHLVVVKNS